jgi:hypothetical protein
MMSTCLTGFDQLRFAARRNPLHRLARRDRQERHDQRPDIPTIVQKRLAGGKHRRKMSAV